MKKLGLDPSKYGFVDYGFGYRDAYPRGYKNPLNYETDEGDSRPVAGTFLPLRSELDYRSRRGIREGNGVIT